LLGGSGFDPTNKTHIRDWQACRSLWLAGRDGQGARRYRLLDNEEARVSKRRSIHDPWQLDADTQMIALAGIWHDDLGRLRPLDPKLVEELKRSTYVNVLQFTDSETRRAFSARVVDQVIEFAPGAFSEP
jgi:hypothetical protein